MDPSADYGCLNGIARHRINTKLIAEHWDDLLRLAGSLKLGVVQATSVMRTLQIGDRPTKLAQAVAELGRIDKTIHALTYIDDETKRRRILNQLNKGEDRHKLARAVFHGKQGELRQRYREGQEDQLGALGLVVNMIVLWNTLYINAALEQLVREGHHVTSEGGVLAARVRIFILAYCTQRRWASQSLIRRGGEEYFIPNPEVEVQNYEVNPSPFLSDVFNFGEVD